MYRFGYCNSEVNVVKTSLKWSLVANIQSTWVSLENICFYRHHEYMLYFSSSDVFFIRHLVAVCNFGVFSSAIWETLLFIIAVSNNCGWRRWILVLPNGAHCKYFDNIYFLLLLKHGILGNFQLGGDATWKRIPCSLVSWSFLMSACLVFCLLCYSSCSGYFVFSFIPCGIVLH